jgi:alkanesulfonate monooxygenase SsuD/methylene tetrahydromethanopterin reductase-like flavin-dependent oxidoreductase (luciferase family)
MPAPRLPTLSRISLPLNPGYIRSDMSPEKLEFGVFDHVDRAGTPLHQYYEDRLKIVEAYDRLGFYGYHIAEHHSTPLGMAPSPNVFLAAVAQRTRHLRFGPMVFVLPLYHPVRLIEEICMLDHLSGGRLELSFGRGASPIEITLYDEDPAAAQEIYTEGVELILQGLTQKVLDYHGKHFSFSNVPMELEPLQKPYPPIWYGVHSPDSADRAARRALNVVSLDQTGDTRLAIQQYLATWRAAHGASAPLPKLGLGRFVVVAETDAQAMRLARRAYRPWYDSFTLLSRHHARAQTHPRPPEFDGIIERGQGIAGSPETVRKFLSAQLAETGCNYVVGQFAFGDLTLGECLSSIDLFATEVMPALRAHNATREALSLAR